jgi:mycofactocin system creatininase family protein
MIAILDDLRSPELRGSAPRLLALPLGATEQHGPHLPVGTDSRIAMAFACRLAERRRDVVVAPVLPYGSSGEHAGFPGTLSIGRELVAQALIEIGRSMGPEFMGLVIVSAHGGNFDSVERAIGVLQGEGRRALAWSPVVPGGDAHAGHVETSLILALAPEQARMDLARPGQTEPLSVIIADLKNKGVRAVAPNGVLGDPTHATPEEGHRLWDYLTDQLSRAVDRAFARKDMQ